LNLTRITESVAIPKPCPEPDPPIRSIDWSVGQSGSRVSSRFLRRLQKEGPAFGFDSTRPRAGTLAALGFCSTLLWLSVGRELLVPMVVLIAAFVRPVEATLAVVALAPVVRFAAARTFGYTGASAELLVLAGGTGCLARRMCADEREARDPVAALASVLATVVVASLGVELARINAVLPPGTLVSAVRHHIAEYARTSIEDNAGLFSALPSAFHLLEGLLIFAVIVGLPNAKQSGVRMLRAFVIGSAAAAALNAAQFVATVGQGDALGPAVITTLRSLRTNVTYSDVNAAGSHFALTLLVSIGLALEPTRRLRLAWLGAALLSSLAVWMSGSRAALLTICAVLFVWLMLQGGRRARRVLPVLAGAAILGASFLPNRASAIEALHIRAELTRASFRLLREGPVFGIGIGRFYQRSAEAILDPGVRTIFPRENAHNNYLQILVELGVVGLAAFLAILAAVLIRAGRRAAGGPVAGAIAGISAFLISCFAGHPLLIPEVSVVFWAVLGALAAATYRVANSRPELADPAVTPSDSQVHLHRLRHGIDQRDERLGQR